MNLEYAKFDQPRTEYNPPVTAPGHFSYLPDVLIPSQHVELGVNPLEKEDDEIIRDAPTPPPTPPELMPGQAGCKIFREGKTYYTDPVFKDNDYVRHFIAKILLLNCIYMVPSFLLLLIVCAWPVMDLILWKYKDLVHWGFGIGIFGVVLYIYLVGLCRNKPHLQIAFGIRMFLTTLCFGCGCIMVHLIFIDTQYDENENPIYVHAHKQQAHATLDDDEIEGNDKPEPADNITLEHLVNAVDYHPQYSRPYMGLLSISLLWVLMVALSFFFSRMGVSASDYRVPILVYSICFFVSPMMVTIVLNNGFHSKPLAYDLFQIIMGCFIVNIVGAATPKHMERVVEGKLCPLREGEVLYATLHYGM